ncbi:MAG TPA: ATP-binding protein [Streptomyces sp.]|nr:ATP-binding protein [Streptomyces sp.]
MTSQLPINTWHDNLGDPTLADAICDRILHTATRMGVPPTFRTPDPIRGPPAVPVGRISWSAG